MYRLSALLIALASGTACATCGSFDVSGTTRMSAQGDSYNGTWRETCGATYGSHANWDLFGDRRVWIEFFPSAAGERDWQALDLEITVGFPMDALQDGEEIGFESLVGEAYLNPGIDSRDDLAALTAGTLTVERVRKFDTLCDTDDATARIKWDLVYGTAPGPLYALHGTDLFSVSGFLSESCPDTL